MDVTKRIYMQAITDGTTAQAWLDTNKSLVQGYNRSTGACVPQWSGMAIAQKPKVWPVIQVGSSYKTPQAGYVWKYNQTAIVWDVGSGDYASYKVSTSHTYVSASGTSMPMFLLQESYTVNGVNVPALIINGDLANAGNVDIDIITFEGSVEDAGFPLPITPVGREVRLSEMVSQGYLGVLELKTPNANIERKVSDWSSPATGSYVVYGAKLFNTTEIEHANYAVKWYLNEVEVKSGNYTQRQAKAQDTGTEYVLTVYEPAVSGVASVRCEFYYKDGSNETLVDTQLTEIRDLQDPETVWVKNSLVGSDGSVKNGDTVTLHRGERVGWQFWMGPQDDSSLESRTSWSSYKVKLFDSGANVLGSTYAAGSSTVPTISSDAAGQTAFADADADGWIDVTHGTDNYGLFYAGWDAIHESGGKMEGLLLVQNTETV